MKKLEEIKKYNTFIYEKYEIEDHQNYIKITYFFEIPGLSKFNPSLEIPKKKDKKITAFLQKLVFHIGLVELISYWKCCCPKNVYIKCGYLNEDQKKWFKKLYFLGLGEFFYTNNIDSQLESFMNISIQYPEENIYEEIFAGKGSMIAIGGGKDSCVSLDLTKNLENRVGFIINPKPIMLECAKTAGLNEKEILQIKRTISPQLIELNNSGFLNGHTPFSAMLAFVSYLTAYLNNKEYIILSNESSANESNVQGTKINHQYSKSYEFENDFNEYVQKYLCKKIKYFSLLRPLNEYQIGMLFSKIPEYHQIFKSCNKGSKEIPWVWCGNCAKCLFVFSLLSPYLYSEKLIAIFKTDLFEKKELKNTFLDLLGFGKNKPFDCVGTYEEVNYAISKTILKLNKENKKLPYLLEFYKQNYPLIQDKELLETQYNEEHSLPKEFEQILERRLYDFTNNIKTRK